MTEVEKLAKFVQRASYDEMSEAARRQLKIRVLDAIGCGIGALAGEPIRYLREQLDDFGGDEICTLIAVAGARRSRGFLQWALVRYLDFNDS